MHLEKIRYKQKTIAYIYLCLDYDPADSKNQLILFLSKNIRDSSVGYAGFRTKQDISDYLAKAVFDSQNDKKIIKFHFDKKRVLAIIKKAIISCHKAISSEPTKIFVFPTFSDFVEKKMSGTTGYAPHKNTILVFINPSGKLWQDALARTIAHEFNHSVILRYNRWETLLDSMVFEGLAEYFQEYAIGGKRTPWTKVLGINQSRKLFLELKKSLQSKNYKLYQAVFFGDKKYPLWSGYSIGYHLVGAFIKNNPGLEWKKIIKLSPREILEKSNF